MSTPLKAFQDAPKTDPPGMRAARFHAARDIRIERIDAPSPDALAPRDVLVRVNACGICGTDLHEYTDGPIYVPIDPHPVTGISLPVTLGHEFSGVVEAVGTQVTTVEVGTPVAAMPQIFCGECSQCLAGRQQTCQNLAAVGYTGPWGGLAEYAILRDDQVFALPDGMSFEQGALVEPAAVAVHALTSAPLKPGDSIFITGGGPIGQLAALAALAFGAGKVVLSEPNARRRTRAEHIRGIRVFDPSVAALDNLLEEVTGGHGFNVCLEASGKQRAIDACFDAVALGGTIVQTAMGADGITVDASHKLTLRDVTYKGVYCYPVTSWPKVISLIASGKIPAEEIISSILPLERLTDAFEALLDPNADELKILIKI